MKTDRTGVRNRGGARGAVMSVDERNVTGLDAADRRRETSSVRHSWASSQPFTLPDIDDTEASAVQLRRAAQRRSVW